MKCSKTQFEPVKLPKTRYNPSEPRKALKKSSKTLQNPTKPNKKDKKTRENLVKLGKTRENSVKLGKTQFYFCIFSLFLLFWPNQNIDCIKEDCEGGGG